MRTRARDYVEDPVIPQRRKRVSAKKAYLQSESIPLPVYLKTHNTSIATHRNSLTDQPDIEHLFNNLKLSDSLSTLLYTSNRKIKSLPPPPPTTPFTSGLKSTFHKPDYFFQTTSPLSHGCDTDTLLRPLPTRPPKTMSLPRSTAPHQVEEWKTVKFKLGLPKLVSGSGDGILRSDGSNYTNWEYRVTRLIETTCGRKGYLDDPQAHVTDPEGDEVMALIIELSVPVDIARKFSECGSARHAFTKVQSMFFFPSRSTHLSTWKDLLDMKFTDGYDLADYLKRVELKIEELDRASFSWSKDSIKGVFYQLGLSSSFTNVSNVLNS